MVSANQTSKLAEVLTTYKRVQAKGTLHTLTFVTINEYLYLLRAISHELDLLKRKALYYLAAAVSDFFLPTQKMVRRVARRVCDPTHARPWVVGTQDPVKERVFAD